MANLVYKNQPATRIDIEVSIQELVSELANAVEEKKKTDPSFDDVAALVDQIANNILVADSHINTDEDAEGGDDE